MEPKEEERRGKGREIKRGGQGGRKQREDRLMREVETEREREKLRERGKSATWNQFLTKKSVVLVSQCNEGHAVHLAWITLYFSLSLFLSHA